MLAISSKENFMGCLYIQSFYIVLSEDGSRGNLGLTTVSMHGNNDP